MKHLLLVLAFVWPATSFLSCKKVIEDKKKEYVLQIMTNGRWYLENYIDNGNDNTADFKNYEFQFYENEKIEAITTTSTDAGTWIGDVNNRTMTVNFPVASGPLMRLNHVWKFLDTSGGVVLGETQTPTGMISIRFRKKA